MTTRNRFIRVSVALGLTAVSALGVAVGSASATDPKSWSVVNAVPNAHLQHGGTVFTSPIGHTLLYYTTQVDASHYAPTISEVDGAGHLGPATVVPPDPTFGRSFTSLGPIDFLPNGDAVVGWSELGGDSMTLVYRFANGTFGPTLKSISATSFAARAGELLTDDGPLAQDYTIGNDGTLTKTGPLIQLATGINTYFNLTMLSADGTADIALQETTNEQVLSFHRTALGVWSQGPNLSDQHMGAAIGSAAPGGRAIIVWKNPPNSYQVTLQAIIRDPVAGFGSATNVITVSEDVAHYFADIPYISTAAGGDGTLGVAFTTWTCQTQNVTETLIGDSRAAVAAPGNGLGGAAVIGGSTNALYSKTRVTSAGAGNGHVIAGYVTTSSTNYPFGSCGTRTGVTGDDSTVTDGYYSDLAGVSRTFGSATSVNGGTTNDQAFLARAGGIDANGNATVLGALSAASSVQFATFGTPGSGVVPTPSASATPTASGSPSPSASPSTTPKVPNAPLLVVKPSGISNKGVLTVTVTAPSHFSNPSDAVTEQLLVRAFNGGVTAHTTGAKAPKPVVLATKSVKLKPKQKLVVKITLSASAKHYLATHKKAVVKLTATTTQKGHKPLVATKAITRPTKFV